MSANNNIEYNQSDEGSDACALENVLSNRLHQMRKDYLAHLPEKYKKMLEAWLHWLSSSNSPSDATDPEASEQFYRLAHNLAGSAAPFGFSEIGAVAKDIMNLFSFALDRTNNLPDSTIDKINLAMNQISQMVDRSVDDGIYFRSSFLKNLDKDISKENLKLIYIVDDDSAYLNQLGAKLHEYGYSINVFTSIESFLNALEEKRPDAIIMDMFLPEGKLAGAEVSLHIDREGFPHIPVVFVSARSDLDSRLAAARAGAIRYFIKPVDISLLLQTLNQITNFVPAEKYKVLLIDDDTFQTDMYSYLLQEAGISVYVLNDSRDTLRMIEEYIPDLILMDVHMPHISGLEMGMVVRQFEEYRHIPIIFLTGEHGIGNRIASLRLGADDFLAKPVAPDFLIEVLRSRIDKAKSLKSGEMRVQKALKELEHYKEALDQHAAVVIADSNGKFIDVNVQFCELAGYSKNDLVGQDFHILKSDEHTRLFYIKLWVKISSGKVWHGQIKNIDRHGKYFWTETTITPIIDEFGMPNRYVAILTDITPIKDFEEVLSSSTERLSLALEATHTGLWEWNLKTNVTFYNESWLSLLGYDPEFEISWSNLIHPEDYFETMEKLLEHIVDKNDFYVTEHRKLNSSGEWDWVVESGKIVERDVDGDVVRIIGTMQVINDRKAMESIKIQLQQQLVQSSKMEAMGHLTAGVAHDFNNILGGMLGYAELSTGMLSRDHPNLDKLKRYMNEISLAGNRAANLVAQMLIFGRSSPENDTGIVPIVQIKPIMTEVVKLLRSTIQSTIDINHVIMDDDLIAKIEPVHLHQILLNLGINARDVMGKYGRLDFRQAALSLGKESCASCNLDFGGDYVEISVIDTGPGISSHILPNIFDPFFTTKKVGEGSGMGLAVVHGIVHSLGGHILIETNNEGTAIRILLPRVLSNDNVDQAGNFNVNDNEMLSGIRIMVVDDEHIMASMLKELLETYGAKVTSYTHSPTALIEFQSNTDKIDLIISDETMPELSGMHMAQEMMKIEPDFPVILCTGYSDHATPLSVSEIGVAALMNKPLNIPELLKNIKLHAKNNNKK